MNNFVMPEVGIRYDKEFHFLFFLVYLLKSLNKRCLLFKDFLMPRAERHVTTGVGNVVDVAATVAIDIPEVGLAGMKRRTKPPVVRGACVIVRLFNAAIIYLIRF